jgi:hypothetical protein
MVFGIVSEDNLLTLAGCNPRPVLVFLKLLKTSVFLKILTFLVFLNPPSFSVKNKNCEKTLGQKPKITTITK